MLLSLTSQLSCRSVRQKWGQYCSGLDLAVQPKMIAVLNLTFPMPLVSVRLLSLTSERACRSAQQTGRGGGGVGAGALATAASSISHAAEPDLPAPLQICSAEVGAILQRPSS